MSNVLTQYIGGAVILGYLLIALFFLKFSRQTRDPFFRRFAHAFAIFALGRVGESVIRNAHASMPTVFLFRLIAHLIIIYAIVKKNRHAIGQDQR